jgi:hypothetical protein
MIITFQNLITSLDEEIKTINSSELNGIKKTQCIVRKIRELESLFKKDHTFKTKEEEINFFKHLKPIFYSKLFYYNDILNVECGRPYGGGQMKRDYFENCLAKIGEHFIRNRIYYEYHRLGATHFDDRYFTIIKKFDEKYDQAGYQIQCEDELSSTHDLLFAKIISNDKLEWYLTNEILKLETASSIVHEPEKAKLTHLKWTESKASAVEVIYAIYSASSLNEGRADIKEIVMSFEKMYNIQLGDFYRTFSEIKLRANQTRYLDTLKDKLLIKMNQEGAGD